MTLVVGRNKRMILTVLTVYFLICHLKTIKMVGFNQIIISHD